MQLTKKTVRKKYQNKTANQERKIKMLLSSPIHLAHHRSTVEPLSLRCRTDIAPLLYRYRYAIVLLSLHCRTATASISHQYRSTVAPPLLLCCRASVALLLHRYCSTVAPLLLLLLLLHSRTVMTPLSNRDRSGPERV